MRTPGEDWRGSQNAVCRSGRCEMVDGRKMVEGRKEKESEKKSEN